MAGRQRDAFLRCPTVPMAYLALCGAFTLFGFDPAGTTQAPSPPAARRPLLVGSIELKPCPSAAAYCGSLDRPLDPTGAIPGRISIQTCASAVPPLRLVPRFAVHAAQLAPAVADAGNRASPTQLRWISAAVMTAGDVLARLGALTRISSVPRGDGASRISRAGGVSHRAGGT